MPRANKGYRLRRKPGGVYEAVAFVQGRSSRFSLQSDDQATAARRLAAALRERALAGAEADPIVLTIPQECAPAAADAICRCPDWASRVALRAAGDGDMEITIPLSAVRPDGEERSTKPMCGALLDQYKKEHVDVKAVDKERVAFAIANLKAHFGSTPVDLVDIPLCRAYREKRSAGAIGRPSAGSTVRRELSALVSAFKHAAQWKRITLADIPHVELPPKPPARDRVLDRHHPDGCELTRLFAAAAGRPKSGKDRLSRCYRFVAVAYYTGWRKRAVETLQWFQVDFEAMEIRPPRGKVQTKKRQPAVPIDDALLPILKRAFDEKRSEYVLDHPGDIRSTFEAACEVAKLEGVTRHTLRHSRGTHLAEDGKDPYWVSRLLGDTLETVDRNYFHSSAREVRRGLWGKAADGGG